MKRKRIADQPAAPAVAEIISFADGAALREKRNIEKFARELAAGVGSTDEKLINEIIAICQSPEEEEEQIPEDFFDRLTADEKESEAIFREYYCNQGEEYVRRLVFEFIKCGRKRDLARQKKDDGAQPSATNSSQAAAGDKPTKTTKEKIMPSKAIARGNKSTSGGFEPNQACRRLTKAYVDISRMMSLIKAALAADETSFQQVDRDHAQLNRDDSDLLLNLALKVGEEACEISSEVHDEIEERFIFAPARAAQGKNTGRAKAIPRYHQHKSECSGR